MINLSKKGFTLIELLVVISIISMLTSVVISSLNDARTKARDMARIRSMQEIRTALQMYFNDKGVYPYSGTIANCGNIAYTPILLRAKDGWMP